MSREFTVTYEHEGNMEVEKFSEYSEAKKFALEALGKSTYPVVKISKCFGLQEISVETINRKEQKAKSKRENYTGFVYQFVGGAYGGKIFNYQELEARGLINGYSNNWSAERENGRVVPREELDNQPKTNGYLGPMYDGVRYIVDGRMKYAFECTEEEKMSSRSLHVIRYETQEVYNMMSR